MDMGCKHITIEGSFPQQNELSEDKAERLYLSAKAENQPVGFRLRLQHSCGKGMGLNKKVASALWKDSWGGGVKGVQWYP